MGLRRKPPRYYVRLRLVEIREKALDLIATAEHAIRQIDDTETIRVNQWRCEWCGNVITFTQPHQREGIRDCDKCQNNRWIPNGEGKPMSD